MIHSAVVTHHIALILQQRYQHIGSERHCTIIQSSLHLRVNQPAHLDELSLGALVCQEPSHGLGQDALVDMHVGLSLEEAPEHKGCQPEPQTGGASEGEALLYGVL